MGGISVVLGLNVHRGRITVALAPLNLNTHCLEDPWEVLAHPVVDGGMPNVSSKCFCDFTVGHQLPVRLLVAFASDEVFEDVPALGGLQRLSVLGVGQGRCPQGFILCHGGDFGIDLMVPKGMKCGVTMPSIHDYQGILDLGEMYWGKLCAIRHRCCVLPDQLLIEVVPDLELGVTGNVIHLHPLGVVFDTHFRLSNAWVRAARSFWACSCSCCSSRATYRPATPKAVFRCRAMAAKVLGVMSR